MLNLSLGFQRLEIFYSVKLFICNSFIFIYYVFIIHSILARLFFYILFLFKWIHGFFGYRITVLTLSLDFQLTTRDEFLMYDIYYLYAILPILFIMYLLYIQLYLLYYPSVKPFSLGFQLTTRKFSVYVK